MYDIHHFYNFTFVSLFCLKSTTFCFLFNQINNATFKKLSLSLETPGDEALEENRRMMWQGKNQQELIQDRWTEFSSTTNEVFVPDDRAWAVAENAAVETDENGEQSGGFVFPSIFL